jgi:hypothetical protein
VNAENFEASFDDARASFSAVALDNAEGIEVAVLNPKVANRFAQTIRRSKTDAADAEVLAEYSRRMPFTSWAAPSSGSIRLRSIVRYIESLSTQSAQNQNRLHAAQSSAVTPGWRMRQVPKLFPYGRRYGRDLR